VILELPAINSDKNTEESRYTEIIFPEKFNIIAAKVVIKGAYIFSQQRKMPVK